MNKYSIFSFAFLGVFFLLFYLMANGISFGSSGKVVITLMVLFPLIGFLSGLKGQKSLDKWAIIAIILNFLAFCTIIFFLVLGLGMGEA